MNDLVVAGKAELVRETLEDEIKRLYPQKELQDVALAYADNVSGEGMGDQRYEEGIKLRNLHFSGEYTDSEIFLKQAKIVGEYNLFCPEIAQKLVEGLKPYNPQFRLAREGSVGVYVQFQSLAANADTKLPEEAEERLREEVDADECSFHNNELRFWWD